MKSLAAFIAVACVAAAQAQPVPDPTDIQVPTVAQLAQLCDGCVWVQQVRVESPKKASAVKAAATLVVSGLLGTSKAAASSPAADGAASQPERPADKAANGVVWDVVVVDKDGTARHVLLTSDPQLLPGQMARLKDVKLSRP